ncbi:MAG TPA: Ada metal-binding domain-containing protein [Sedimentisphaerales bacterium]|nr:Ada metal-binding domain-containing protein [Sedimentisphaerales bacterium]HRS12623.1 Ada metal-binding domain-containing protein [Sedimentisphaerales bacterium]HRV48099.1 Ada metal-binding domain-containing protein [Sedimentisphaerales bacterium]
MTIHICCLLAMLLANPAATAKAADPGRLDSAEPGVLISTNEVLADIRQVCVVLAMHQHVPNESAVDYQRLQALVVEKLRSESIEHVDCRTGLTPRLHVYIEVVPLKDCGLSVYRVQTALSRIVAFTDHRERTVQADVWRVRPVMKAVSDPNLRDELASVVLAQAEFFAGACRAARRPQESTHEGGREPPASPVSLAENVTTVSNPAATVPAFVGSKNSAVFHRADCPLALKIAQRNLVSYATRDEAIAAGKRPCKSCQP